jgi:hypothetical protein
MRRLRRGPGEQHDGGHHGPPGHHGAAGHRRYGDDAGDHGDAHRHGDRCDARHHGDHRDAREDRDDLQAGLGIGCDARVHGRLYHCVGPALLRDLRTLNRRIDRGRRSLRRIRSELRRLKRRYPSKVAPPRVAQRYNYLVRKHNALLRLGNRRVRAYNQRLDRDCTRG